MFLLKAALGSTKLSFWIRGATGADLAPKISVSCLLFMFNSGLKFKNNKNLYVIHKIKMDQLRKYFFGRLSTIYSIESSDTPSGTSFKGYCNEAFDPKSELDELSN